MVAIMATAISLFAEISAFKAGNLNSENPYGLTDNEKELLNNKRNVANIQGDLGSLSEQLQGLQSIIEGINSRMSRIEQRLSELEFRFSSNDSNDSSLTLSSLKSYIDETKAIQESNYKKITNTLNKLGSLIDKKSSQNTTTKQSSNATKTDLSKKDSKTIISDAISLFNANKNNEAKEYFEYLISKKQHTAISNYYLGEIAYKNKMYSEAIKYYQKSISISDTGSYIPKLLYHTGISFDKIGDTANANKFYKALKVGYPDTKEAQASPNRK